VGKHATSPLNLQLALAQPLGWGTLAFGALLAIYFGALTLISGWKFTVGQFAEFWYYIVPLAAGFGIQVALYVRLRQTIRRARDSGTMLAASGTTSTAAMVSCCAHYLANAAPVLGATGLVAFAAQFQVELFWVGLLFNAAGITYVGYRLFKASRAQAPAIDPVCGMSVEPANSTSSMSYQGKTYHFCSQHCAASFRSQPSRYVGSEALKPGAAAG
jgi:YHS domain-containing protein